MDDESRYLQIYDDDKCGIVIKEVDIVDFVKNNSWLLKTMGYVNINDIDDHDASVLKNNGWISLEKATVKEKADFGSMYYVWDVKKKFLSKIGQMCDLKSNHKRLIKQGKYLLLKEVMYEKV